MNKPGLIYVYRTASEGDRVAAYCVSCDAYAPESWDRYGEWQGMRLDTGEAICFRLSVTDMTGGPEGPKEVYGEEEFMAKVAKEDRIAVMLSQNAAYLKIDGVQGQLGKPFFVSLENPTTPCSFQTTLSIVIDGVDELPEVVDYDAHMKSSFTDHWDAMAHAPINKSIRYPVGCRFPATMISGHRECGVVFMLLEAPVDRLARVQVESSDVSIVPKCDVEFVRRFRGTSGKMIERSIGRIVDSPVMSGVT